MKKRTKLLSVLMAVLMLLSALIFPVSAQEEIGVVGATLMREPYVTTCFSGAEEDTASLRGLVIEFELSDGNVETWGFDLCHFPDLGDNKVYWELLRDENGAPIVKDGKVYMRFTCDKAVLDVEYTVIENPVERFELQMHPIVIYEDYSFKYWNPETDEYYYSYNFETEDTVTIYYKDGTSTTDEAMFFEDEYGNSIRLYDTQDVNPWEIGKENYLFAKYLGYEVKIPVEVQPVPVKSIEIAKLPQKVEYEEYYTPLWQGMEVVLNFTGGGSASKIIQDDELVYDAYLGEYTFEILGHELILQEWNGEYILSCYNLEKTIEGLSFIEPRAVADMTVKKVSKTGGGTVIDVVYETGEKETFVFDVSDYWEGDKIVLGHTKTRNGYTDYTVDPAFGDDGSFIGYSVFFLSDYVLGGLDTVIPEGGEDAIIGDADLNGVVDIRDATAIQKHTAGIIVLEEMGVILADVNLGDNVNVKDATAIQKWIAGIDTHVTLPIGDPYIP